MFNLFSNFGDFEAAERTIKQLNVLNPSPKNILQLADLYFFQRKSEAIPLYEEYLKYNENTEVMIDYITSLIYAGRTDTAFEKLDKILEKAEFTDIYKLYTALSIQTGQLNKLENIVKRSDVQSDSVKTEFFANLISQLSYSKFDFTEFKTQIQEYLGHIIMLANSTNRVNIDAMYLSFNIQDTLLVEHFVSKVLLQVDTLDALPIVCAQMTADIGNEESALDILMEFKQKFPLNDDYLLNIAFILMKKKDYDKALEYFTQYKDKDTSKSERWINIADIYSSMDENGLAETNYLKAIELDDKNSTAYNNYAYFLSRFTDRLNDAEKYSYLALSFEKDNAAFLDTYGWILHLQGKTEEGLNFINQAVMLDSTNWEILDHLGTIFEKQGKITEANKYWEKALIINPNNQDLIEKMLRTNNNLR
jgi:Tfp pilus assembly protein PilF